MVARIYVSVRGCGLRSMKFAMGIGKERVMNRWKVALIGGAVGVLVQCCGFSQGALTFSGWVDPYGTHGTNYYEQGFWFRVVVPTPGAGSPSHDGMVIVPAITTPANIPYNDTPYMLFFR